MPLQPCWVVTRLVSKLTLADTAQSLAGMPAGATLDELATKMGAQSSVPVQVQALLVQFTTSCPVHVQTGAYCTK